MLLSTKGYYSMSPYDDGYVSFLCFHLNFLSLLRCPLLILLVPRRVSFSSSTSSPFLYVCLPFLYYTLPSYSANIPCCFPVVPTRLSYFEGMMPSFVAKKKKKKKTSFVSQTRTSLSRRTSLLNVFVLKDCKQCPSS